jgi:hypothetical protein
LSIKRVSLQDFSLSFGRKLYHNSLFLKLFKKRDIQRILNSSPPIESIPPPSPPPKYQTSNTQETARSDRIRIRIALDFVSPRRIQQLYAYTLTQIRRVREQQAPRKKGRCCVKLKIKKVKREEMTLWLLGSPSHRRISFRQLPEAAPELGLEGVGFEAIRTAFDTEGYG